MTLTKAQVAESIQNRIGFPRKKSIELLETLLEIIKKSLETGDDILVSGFGKFCVKHKAERKGRNPATGDDLMLPPRKVVSFKCSSVLRDRITGKR
ncbi:MAG: integration host factor subunit alpha [Deltaproteobacteria bacterium]|nr:integration host factor subunit alpha [Deltaproteobacteria bacterium]